MNFTLAEGLGMYCEEAAILTAVAFFALALRRFAWNSAGQRPSTRYLLLLSQAILLLAGTFPLILRSLPRQTLMAPHAQIWSSFDSKEQEILPRIQFNLSSQHQTSSVPLLSLPDGIFLQIGIVFTGIFLLLFMAVLFRAWRVRQTLRLLPTLRRLGNVSIHTGDVYQTPFALWWGFTAYVFIPEKFLESSILTRVSILHELQHHRNGDTGWAYFHEALRCAFFWNPAVYLVCRVFRELQEFACDESLVGRRGISPQVYGRCLLEAAEFVSQPRLLWSGTTHMAGAAGTSILKRRVLMLFERGKTNSRPVLIKLLGLGTAACMALVAYTAHSAIEMRKLTMQQASEYARTANEGSRIPIEMNDLVLEKINYYVATPEGREQSQKAYRRMGMYEKMILGKLKAANMPEELLAIPLLESGFTNQHTSPAPYKSRGIWQFIAGTAKRYDLKIGEYIDERLDPEKETDAAIRYLSDLYDQFQDWRLAIKAYNIGEAKLMRLRKQNPTATAWDIERASKESYLSGAVAAMILVKHPELFQ